MKVSFTARLEEPAQLPRARLRAVAVGLGGERGELAEQLERSLGALGRAGPAPELLQLLDTKAAGRGRHALAHLLGAGAQLAQPHALRFAHLGLRRLHLRTQRGAEQVVDAGADLERISSGSRADLELISRCDRYARREGGEVAGPGGTAARRGQVRRLIAFILGGKRGERGGHGDHCPVRRGNLVGLFTIGLGTIVAFVIRRP